MSTTTSVLHCEDCGTETTRGQRTIRTTLRNGVPAPVAWCRDCRPLEVRFVPAQRSAS